MTFAGSEPKRPQNPAGYAKSSPKPADQSTVAQVARTQNELDQVGDFFLGAKPGSCAKACQFAPATPTRMTSSKSPDHGGRGSIGLAIWQPRGVLQGDAVVPGVIAMTEKQQQFVYFADRLGLRRRVRVEDLDAAPAAWVCEQEPETPPKPKPTGKATAK